MYTQYFVVNDGCQSETVEYISAVLPDIQRAILPQTFIIEAIHLGYLAGLMVSSDEGYPWSVSDLQCYEQLECFDAIDTTIDKVSQK